MATITHTFVSAISDDNTPTGAVGPDEWNDDHTISGTAALTKNDDTNVTLTLGGSPGTALFDPVSLTLGWMGTLAVSRGGIGVGTLASNGVLYGNGTSAVQALAVNATATNKFLRQVSSGTPSWQTIAAGDLPANGANPTASVGLSAVNGSATTWMRSDGAPALDQTIVPTWTGLHTFSGNIAHPLTILASGASSASTLKLTARNASADNTWWISSRGGVDSNNLGFFNNAVSQMMLLTPSGELRVLSYVSAGTLSAPSNTTAGDITGLRLHVGTDAAFTSGMGFEMNSIQGRLGGSKTLTGSLDSMFTNSPTITNNTSTFISAMHIGATFNGSADSGIAMLVRPFHTPSANVTDVYGGYINCIAQPPVSVTVSNMYGHRSVIASLGGAGAITNAYAIFADGVFVNSGGVTPTNVFGLRISAASGGTNNYDIRFDTVDTSAAGAYYGKVPCYYNGLKKYLHLFS